MSNESIFKEYYSEVEFVDRVDKGEEKRVDVIIPVINTNELWSRNLYSFYREIPINRLIVGNGGCTDDTIEIVSKFPRVELIDQSEYSTQGYCIKELIQQVETEIFVYLHADVFLPEGWFDEMYKHKDEFEWFECIRRHTFMVDYWHEKQNKSTRAYSGSQMGKKKAFDRFLDIIEDDFLQRNEDIVLAEMVKENGDYARIDDTFHYHQVMERESPTSSFGEKEPQVKSVSVTKETNENWEKKVNTMQWKGIVKYTSPTPYLIDIVKSNIQYLLSKDHASIEEIKRFIQTEGANWDQSINVSRIYWKAKIKDELREMKNRVVKFLVRREVFS